VTPTVQNCNLILKVLKNTTITGYVEINIFKSTPTYIHTY